jgi:hypothetical protein
VDVLKQSVELDGRATYLMLKDRLDTCMYAELVMNIKPKRGHSENQLWIVSNVRKDD